jgi:hypothetical protein
VPSRFFASGEGTRQVLSPKGHNGGLTPQIADFINTIDPNRPSTAFNIRTSDCPAFLVSPVPFLRSALSIDVSYLPSFVAVRRSSAEKSADSFTHLFVAVRRSSAEKSADKFTHLL